MIPPKKNNLWAPPKFPERKKNSSKLFVLIYIFLLVSFSSSMTCVQEKKYLCVYIRRKKIQ